MKKQVNVLTKIAALALLAVAAAPAMAQQAGDTVVNVGWFHLAPQDSSKNISVNSAFIPGMTIPNTGASVSDADTIGLQINHFVTDNWDISADLGIPPKFKLTGSGILSGTSIGSAKQWSPALLAKYFFGDSSSKFRPFLGAGATYVWYSNIQLTDQFQNQLSDLLTSTAGFGTGFGLKSSVKLSSSFAPVVTAGGVYNINDKWSLGLSVSYIPLKTKADITTNTPLGPVYTSTKLTLNPIVSFLSVGYKF
ncbi:OmpW/AlkL family protein [Glaciimonas soli]|uniref:Outer membrane beta-barrel protein n=1 Tax=Glaciimonas soli TaxID=2590999 RepID=A0A843YX67_9BURK|nr:OmpW family outer membrane protein [Glaciimonas soli]MQR01891.1 outer membrane beta-barrel protein [Glaciimonas soli]